MRKRLLLPAIERANVKLAELGIDPIDTVSPHGLGRRYASLRSAVGDDPAYTAAQLGHEDPTFSLRVYTHAVKRRERLSGRELDAFNQAVEWARMGTNTASDSLSLEAALLSPAPDPASQAASR